MHTKLSSNKLKWPTVKLEKKICESKNHFTENKTKPELRITLIIALVTKFKNYANTQYVKYSNADSTNISHSFYKNNKNSYYISAF